EELFARGFFLLTGQKRQLVVPVKVYLERLADGVIAVEKLVLYVWFASRRQQCWEPIKCGKDFIADLSRPDATRPADHRRHPISTFPVGVLLAAERRHAAVRPRVHVYTVVGAVDDDGVVSDAQIIERLEQVSDVTVMFEHAVHVFAETAAASIFRPHMSVEMHARAVPPAEERLVCLDLPLDKVDCRV